MIQCGSRPGFSNQPFARIAGRILRNDFDGDATVQLEIRRAIHDPHAATTNLRIQAITPAQDITRRDSHARVSWQYLRGLRITRHGWERIAIDGARALADRVNIPIPAR